MLDLKKYSKMLKLQSTRRELSGAYQERTISVGYCRLQDFFSLMGVSPVAFTRGIYGWNFDFYLVNTAGGHEIGVSTGYRNMFGYSPDYKEVEALEIWAQKKRERLYELKGAGRKRALTRYRKEGAKKLYELALSAGAFHWMRG